MERSGFRCVRCGRLWMTGVWFGTGRSECMICEGALVSDRDADPRAVVVRECFGAWNSGDIEGLLSHMAESIDWEPTGILLGDDVRRFEGLDDMREWAGMVAQRWLRTQIHLQEVELAGDDAVFVTGVLDASSRTDDRVLSEPLAWRFWFEGPKVTRIDEWRDVDAARAEVLGG